MCERGVCEVFVEDWGLVAPPTSARDWLRVIESQGRASPRRRGNEGKNRAGRPRRDRFSSIDLA